MSDETGAVTEKWSSLRKRKSGRDTRARLLQSLHSDKPVRGLTHGFYRYPARFSPEFARSVIEAFSRPGDIILDPFVGGGTTVVEALASGRKVVGVDLNPLAVFTARIKSTPLSDGFQDRTRMKSPSRRKSTIPASEAESVAKSTSM